MFSNGVYTGFTLTKVLDMALTPHTQKHSGNQGTENEYGGMI